MYATTLCVSRPHLTDPWFDTLWQLEQTTLAAMVVLEALIKQQADKAGQRCVSQCIALAQANSGAHKSPS